MFKFVSLLCVLPCLSLDVILVVTEPSQSLKLAELPQLLEESSNLRTRVVLIDDLDSCSATSVSVLIDFNTELGSDWLLSSFGFRHSLPILVFEKPARSSPIKFQVKLSSDREAQALLAVLSYFNWSRFVLIVENSDSYLEVGKQVLAGLFTEFVETFYLPPDYPDKTLDLLVSRVSRWYALNAYIFIGSGELAARLEASLARKNLLNTGAITLFGSDACWAAKTVGALCVFDENLPIPTTAEEYIASMLLDMLVPVQEGLPASPLSSLSRAYPSNSKEGAFILLNLQEAGLMRVGSFTEDSFLLENDMTFIGPTSTVPVTGKLTIEFSINDSAEEYDGTPEPENSFYLQGAHYAMTLLDDPYYDFVLNSFDCGAFEFNYDYAKACVEDGWERLGVAFIDSIGSSMAKEMHQLFEELNKPLPQLSCCADSNGLSDRTTYNFFSRVVNSKAYRSGIMARLMQILGIYECAVVYSSMGWSLEYYESFVALADTLGLKILNAEENRMFPVYYSPEMFDAMKDMFQAVIDTKARFLVYIDVSGYFLEGLYRMGLRAGDIIVVLPGPYEYRDEDPVVDARVQELLTSALSLDVTSFVDEVGAATYEGLQDFLSVVPNSYHCFSADVVFLLKEALDLMVYLGEDLTDASQFQKRIQGSRVKGCSGLVSINSDSNDRSSELYYLYHGQFDEVLQAVEYVPVATFNPLGIIILSYSQAIVWPDGSTDLPSTLRLDDAECPFDQEDVQTNGSGALLLYILVPALILGGALITLLLLHRHWAREYPLLEKEEVMSMNDILVTASIPVEAIQVISLGPQPGRLFWVLASVSNTLTLNAEYYLEVYEHHYWTLIQVTLMLSSAWVMLSLVYIMKLDQSFPRLKFLSTVYATAEHLVVPLTVLAYIPILSVLASIFDCSEGIGNDLTDSFLAEDCYISCWQGEHLWCAILVSFALLAYQPLSLHCRQLLQERTVDVFLKQQPKLILFKTAVIETLLVLKVVRISGMLYNVAFVVLVAGLAFLQLRRPPFNYGRANVMQVVATLCVFWVGVALTIPMPDWAQLLTCLLGWGLVLIPGTVFYFRSPGLLSTGKDKRLEPFIRFQFSRKMPEDFGIAAKTINFVEHDSNVVGNK